jgi:DNA-binding response OmpR family regulator
VERTQAHRTGQIGELRDTLRRASGHVAVVVPAGGDPAAVERELAANGIPVVRYREDHALPESPIKVDMARRLAYLEGERVEMPPKEFDILAELVGRGGRPVAASELAKRVWPPDEHASVDDVHRHIYRLRKALGPRGDSLISNRRGFGYVLET